MRRPLAALVAAAILSIAAAMPLAAKPLPACVASCDLRANSVTDCCSAGFHPELTTACTAFNDCRRTAISALEDCVAKKDKCSPINPGRCTLNIEQCSDPCRFRYKLDLKQCERELKGTVNAGGACSGEIHGRRALLAVERACRTCPGGRVGRAAVPFPEPDNGCQRSCLERIPTAQSCYDDCDSRCDGDRFALSICRQSCRNLVCRAAIGRCRQNGAAVDRDYLRCCVRAGDCADTIDGLCSVTTSTTTTTTTTTTITTTSSTTTLFGQTTTSSTTTTTL